MKYSKSAHIFWSFSYICDGAQQQNLYPTWWGWLHRSVSLDLFKDKTSKEWQHNHI